MTDLKIIADNKPLSVLTDRKRLLAAAGCTERGILYDSICAELDKYGGRIDSALDVRYSACSDGGRIYVAITAGEAVSTLSSELFDAGEGLAGLLVNNAADEALFAADEAAAKELERYCASIKRGIKERQDDVKPSEVLKRAALHGVTVTDGNMLSPVKSMCYELVLADDETVMRGRHNCAQCKSVSCPRRSAFCDGRYDIVSDFDFDAAADGVCIDIGTTTVAAVRLENGKPDKVYTELNVQRRFGADVLSRIEAANRGRGAELKSMIRYQLRRCVNAVGGAGLKTVIAANTAMTSLLMGYDCSGLGMYPFRAESTETAVTENSVVVGGISAFIGGDIVSGLYMCGFADSEDVNMLIDLGTNAEMAIGSRHRILCTSAAAGPAFEGGRISCGTGSVEGAVCGVDLTQGRIETIGGAAPCGICGTGITELAAELLRCGYMDSSGRLAPGYENGFTVAEGVTVTQKDLREIQMAKAAVRAGTEILIEEYGISPEDIKNVYIAGGFGRRLDMEKACAIGLIPPQLKDKCKAVGNSSLGGCARLLAAGDAVVEINRIRSVAEDFPLAENDRFNDLFLRYMEF